LVIVLCKVKTNKPLKEWDMLSTGPDSIVYTVSLLLKKSRIRNQIQSHLREDTNDMRKTKTFLEGSPRTLQEYKGGSLSCRPVRDHMIDGFFFLTFIAIRILLRLVVGARLGPTGGGIRCTRESHGGGENAGS
jgi:hypothetical protein